MRPPGAVAGGVALPEGACRGATPATMLAGSIDDPEDDPEEGSWRASHA
jgi:hypothetical protein